MTAKRKVATQIRLDEDLYATIKDIADHEMRSINAQMEYFIKSGAEHYKIERTNFLNQANQKKDL